MNITEFALNYRVSEFYLANRRGGPRRVSIMLVLVFGFIAFLGYWQRERSGSESLLVSIAFTGILMTAIGFFVIRRAMKMTLELESLVVAVTPGGIRAESAKGLFTLKSGDIRRITMYRTVFAPKMTFFVFIGRNGDATLPPLENADSFAKEIREALPAIPFVHKRKLMANFVG